MGGTFDPVHNGHLVAAEEAWFQFALEKVVFIPSARPPHKKEIRSAPFEDRYRMVELAIDGNPRLSVSDMEIGREGLSYTIDTLRELHRMHGKEAELFLIIGADEILDFKTWKEPAEVITESRIIAAARPGYPLERLSDSLPEYASNGEPALERVKAMRIPALEVSSTDIRARVAGGFSLRYLVPEPVRAYILEKGLYLERS